jgi:hypothetical protein
LLLVVAVRVLVMVQHIFLVVVVQVVIETLSQVN